MAKNKYNPKTYAKEQIALMEQVIQHLVDEHGFEMDKPVNEYGMNLFKAIRDNRNTIGYLVNKRGAPIVDKLNPSRVSVFGHHDEIFVEEVMRKFGMETLRIETHVGDLLYFMLVPSQSDWRKIIIDEFLDDEKHCK